MYEFCVVVQYIGIIMVLIGLGYLLRQWQARQQAFMLFLGVALLVNSVGYLFEISSTTMEGALMATKLSYVGKIYIVPLAFCFVLHYCKIKFSNLLVVAITAVHTAVLVLVLSCEHHDLFYTTIEYSKEGIFPHLEHGHGVVYKAYIILVVCYALLMLGICVSRYRKAEKKEKSRVLYLAIIVLLPMLGLVLYLSGITQGYDATAVCYVLSGIVLLVSIFRHDFFDTVNLAKNYVVENLSDGLVVLGNQDQFVYANAPALRLFPQLDGNNCNEAIEEIRSHCGKNIRLHVEERVYKVSRQDIFQNRTRRGKMFYLQDVTDSYNYTTMLEREVWKKTKQLVNTQHSLIVSLANMVEARDGVTGLHIMHTSAYVKIIAKALQKMPEYQDVLTDDYVEVLSEAAPLHDIGKISMPDAILRKEGSLTTDELKTIHSHPELGAQIIDSVLADVESNDYLVTAREMAYYHHERWDGSGYPLGLKGKDIPLSARIMAIADVYDALRSQRSYKEACSKEEAKQIIMEQAGKQFDPNLVSVFLRNLDKIEAVK